MHLAVEYLDQTIVSGPATVFDLKVRSRIIPTYWKEAPALIWLHPAFNRKDFISIQKDGYKVFFDFFRRDAWSVAIKIRRCMAGLADAPYPKENLIQLGSFVLFLNILQSK